MQSKERKGSNFAIWQPCRDNNGVYAHSDATDEQGLPHPKVKYDEDKFQITLDCQHYRPEELDVKVEGNTIIITAKQGCYSIEGNLAWKKLHTFLLQQP